MPMIGSWLTTNGTNEELLFIDLSFWILYDNGMIASEHTKHDSIFIHPIKFNWIKQSLNGTVWSLGKHSYSLE